MTLLSLLAWAGGIILIGVGYMRARGPWARYQALREQERNVARYEAWRGGVRDSSPTGASVAMRMLWREVQIGVADQTLGDCEVVRLIARVRELAMRRQSPGDDNDDDRQPGLGFHRRLPL